MSWEVRQTRRFSRIYKKLHDNVAADVDEAVQAVMANPNIIGEQKKGDLSQLFVYKFRSQNQLYLLGYTCDDSVRLIYLETVGPHENFYRDLKRQSKR
ncbi:type II toxin-antitoxin system RelE/ParE family toxin [endosymbiont of Lamellibrachia barhami]|uniref:type II toxin-antitoxin system RelE/ParE family toxin n=1 Tax=endosymbiont of Lamellibrachia barhami TaxID=205975 RepID=UPI0015AF7E95|nr:type II toxin-antitoxin system RelE/ParE family toxin [endosymbiont of Lamellibrachia barhami]